MAADYETGISSSPTDLLQTLVSFLSAQGWTTDQSAASGSGWRAHLHKAGLYVNMRAAMNELIWPENGTYHDALHSSTGGYGIGLYLGDGYDSGDGWHEQSGAPVRLSDGSTAGCGANLPSGSVAAYHIFDDGADHIIVVVERSPGIFCFFGWGPALEPAGQPEAFPYFYGSSGAVLNTIVTPLTDRTGIQLTAMPPMSHADKEDSSYGATTERIHATAYVRVDAATYSGRWISNNEGTDGGYGYTGRNMGNVLSISPGGSLYTGQFPFYYYLKDRAYQVAFAGALLLPIHNYVLTDPGARWAPIGWPPNVFWCEAVGNGYAAGSVYQVGGDDYMVFPHFAVRKGA
jgi:hypothetical protein